MADMGITRTAGGNVVLVALPDGERAADLGRALAAEHLMPVMAFDGEALRTFATDQSFAAVVVDPAIEDAVGARTLLDTVRAATPAPIVVLGFVPGDGAGALAPGISGLLGADASPADVVGTVVTAIARGLPQGEVVACAELVVDLRNFEAWQGTRRLDLTPTELRLLGALVGAHGDLVTKQSLQRSAWGTAGAHDDNRLQAHIRRLRTKLQEPGDPCAHLRTVRGLGFRLDLPGPDVGPHRPPAGDPVHEATEIDSQASPSHR
jgi:two-component system copper resistance phosphate regulon response regulator CusR